MKKELILKEYIREAVEIEKAGLKVEYKDVSEYDMPEELQNKLAENETFRNAFNALTPGRKKVIFSIFRNRNRRKHANRESKNRCREFFSEKA